MRELDADDYSARIIDAEYEAQERDKKKGLYGQRFSENLRHILRAAPYRLFRRQKTRGHDMVVRWPTPYIGRS